MVKSAGAKTRIRLAGRGHKREQENAAWGKYTNNEAFGDMMMGRETYDDSYSNQGQVQIDGYPDYLGE